TQEETENEKQLLSAAPIYNDNRIAGYLVLILKPGKINDFMLEVNPANGLGNTGETYLVGPDFLMRSQSRFIEKSIMKTYVKTRPVTEALNNRAGTAQVTDYRGLKVLSSYGLVKTAGLNWVILAEIDYEEATASIYGIRNNIMLLTVFTGIAFFILTYAISRKITKPLIRLKDAAIELGEGRLDTLVGIESNDEIGELTEAFNSMAVSLREKDEALKAERINRLKSAIDGQDMERQRLSRELHDGIGQNLIAIRLRLGALENDIPDKLNQKIQSVITLTDSLIDEVRAISNALMPPALAEFGLTTAIRNLCSNLTETTGITTEFTGEIPGQKLGRKARLYIFRIFQETFNNVAKHSEATHLKIETKTDAHIFIITITDNGKGFNVESPCASGGHGLGNMVERANLLKGQATIQSSPGSGTLIRIEIPLNKSIL
ncbi:MAG TPA: histidine kinase, partial [Lentimicrobium sp.]|nr:histidine kinase [Lentimicrobium sp.]